MKKIFVALLAALSICASSSFAANLDVALQLGLNLYTSAESSNQDFDMDFFSPTFDLRIYGYPFSESSPLGNLGIGAGLGFKYVTTSDRDFGWMFTANEGYNAGNYIMPLYASLKAKFTKGKTADPYAFVDLGYAFWWADDGIDYPYGYRVYTCYTDGGFFTEFGLGLDFSFGLNLALSYSMFSGEIYTEYQYSGSTYIYNPDIDFGFFNVSVGFHF